MVQKDASGKFYTICNKNQLLKVKFGKVMAILVPRRLGDGWPKWVSCRKSQVKWAEYPKHQKIPTVALTESSSRKCFEYSKHFEKECLYKITYLKLYIFEKNREPGHRYRYQGILIEHDPVTSP
jgi:hypothetical protein